jgi:hypothetical protein
MTRRGVRYLPLIVCQVALLGSAARACAAFLPPAGKSPPPRLSAESDPPGCWRDRSPAGAPCRTDFAEATHSLLALAAARGDFLAGDRDWAVAEGDGGGMGGEPAPQPRDAGWWAPVPMPLALLAGCSSGMGSPPGGATDRPPAPVAGLLPGPHAAPPPIPVRLERPNEVILLCSYFPRVYRPPRATSA